MSVVRIIFKNEREKNEDIVLFIHFKYLIVPLVVSEVTVKKLHFHSLFYSKLKMSSDDCVGRPENTSTKRVKITGGNIEAEKSSVRYRR